MKVLTSVLTKPTANNNNDMYPIRAFSVLPLWISEGLAQAES